jgi:hypothetical protein
MGGYTRSGFQLAGSYAAFSVSKSNVSAVAKYIGTQKERHRKLTFELKKHGVDYDPKFVFG